MALCLAQARRTAKTASCQNICPREIAELFNRTYISIRSNSSENAELGTPMYPNIAVTLTGTDGNAFAILSRCTLAMLEAGIQRDVRVAFIEQATAGDHDNVLTTARKWFVVSYFRFKPISRL